MVTPQRTEQRVVRLADWPTVDSRALPHAKSAVFKARVAAVTSYSRGQPLARIEADTGLHRATLLRLIARALRPHPDGRLWGFRALVPQTHVRAYERSVTPRVLVDVKAGNAGAFSQLLMRHPPLSEQLRSEVTEGKVTLQPGGERGRLSGLQAAIGRFQRSCRDLGLTGADSNQNLLNCCQRPP